MANLPRSAYSLNGGLAFAGAPAHGNPVAAEMVNPAEAQVKQSLQQTQTQQAVRGEAAQVAANNLAMQYKSRLQQAVGPEGLPGLAAIAANRGITENLGLPGEMGLA